VKVTDWIQGMEYGQNNFHYICYLVTARVCTTQLKQQPAEHVEDEGKDKQTLMAG
jgi:hypothetical protein